MIQATDTDILVILLGNMDNLNDKIIFISSAFNKKDREKNGIPILLPHRFHKVLSLRKYVA